MLKASGFIAATTTGNVLPAGTTVLFIEKFGLLRLLNDPAAYSFTPAPGYRSIPLNTGGETTEITTTDYTDLTDKADVWYRLDGRRINDKPTTKGIYINKGKKRVVK